MYLKNTQARIRCDWIEGVSAVFRSQVPPELLYDPVGHGMQVVAPVAEGQIEVSLRTAAGCNLAEYII